MSANRYPDRWVTIVTGKVTYVGTETLLDGRTAGHKEAMQPVQAVRFDVKVRATTHPNTEHARRTFKEFWCLYLGERPSFLTKGARVMGGWADYTQNDRECNAENANNLSIQSAQFLNNSVLDSN